jgi:3D-(3,5/4)-trihydroxycyclohexane-1,2-dione acylhydrolase (decyclizing)
VGVDVAAHARSFGIDVAEPASIEEFRTAFSAALAGPDACVIVMKTALIGPNPPGSAWWDVPVGEVSTLESTQEARADYERAVLAQRSYLAPGL